MYHRLQFLAEYRLDLQVPGKARLEQLLIRQGEIIEAQVQPFVVETADGPVEAANLYLHADGTLLNVPMEYFRFA
jgi:hypothetical protein